MAPTPMTTAPDTIPMREKFAYGFGDLACCLYWQTVSTYLLIFYTDIFGLTALAAGAMIGLSRSTDAFIDPVIGMISDRRKSRWGKFRPYLLWGGVPLAIAGFLTFTVPDLGARGKLVWAYVTFNALMIIYTVIT